MSLFLWLFSKRIKSITGPKDQTILTLTQEIKELKQKLVEKQVHIERTNAYWAQQVEKLKQNLRAVKNS